MQSEATSRAERREAVVALLLILSVLAPGAMYGPLTLQMPLASAHSVPTRGDEGRYKSPEPGCNAYVFFSFSVVSLFVDLLINPFTPNPTHSASDSLSSRFSVKNF